MTDIKAVLLYAEIDSNGDLTGVKYKVGNKDEFGNIEELNGAMPLVNTDTASTAAASTAASSAASPAASSAASPAASSAASPAVAVANSQKLKPTNTTELTNILMSKKKENIKFQKYYKLQITKGNNTKYIYVDVSRKHMLNKNFTIEFWSESIIKKLCKNPNNLNFNNSTEKINITEDGTFITDDTGYKGYQINFGYFNSKKYFTVENEKIEIYSDGINTNCVKGDKSKRTRKVNKRSGKSVRRTRRQ